MITATKEIFRTYGYFHIMVAVIHICAIVSLFFLDVKYFLYGVLYFMLASPLMDLIAHEYVAHESIKPRNRFFDLIFLVFFYCHGQSSKKRREYHIAHHIHYLDPSKDPTQIKIAAAGNIWRYLFNLQKPVAQNLVSIKNSLCDSNAWARILEPHALKITWAYRVIMFILLPIEWFVVTVVYFQWLFILVFNFHDVYFHGSLKRRDGPWYLPFWNNGSWHIRHHENPNEIYFGGNLWRWFNTAWYYYLLFFVPGPNAVTENTQHSKAA